MSCSISIHELSWDLFESMVEQFIGRTMPECYPGDEAVTNLLCLICMEQGIPLRFYHREDLIEVEVLDTEAEVDWVNLYDHFTTEYTDILLPEPKPDVKEEFYQVVEDNLQ